MCATNWNPPYTQDMESWDMDVGWMMEHWLMILILVPTDSIDFDRLMDKTTLYTP